MQSVLKKDDAHETLWRNFLLSTRRSLVDHINSLWRGSLRWLFLPEDLLQETWAELWRLNHRFRGETREEFLAWAKRIAEYTARNLARSHRYKKRSQQRLCFLEELDPKDRLEVLSRESTSESPIEAGEQQEIIAQALSKLSSVEAKLIDLVCFEEMPVGKAAEIMGITSSGVRKRLQRSLEKLYSHLKRHPDYQDLF